MTDETVRAVESGLADRVVLNYALGFNEPDLYFLQYLYGTTRVVDGDLSPLVGLPHLQDLRMQNRRHYRPSAQEIKASLPRGPAHEL